MTHDEMLEVIKAHKDGKDLEVMSKRQGLKWHLRPNNGLRDANFNFDSYNYRVKREPRVIYARIEECGLVGSASTDKEEIEDFHRKYGGELVKFVEVMED